MKNKMTFDTWFKTLTNYATHTKGMGWIINKDDPESYREYYDDGVSPQDTFATERSYAAGDCW